MELDEDVLNEFNDSDDWANDILNSSHKEEEVDIKPLIEQSSNLTADETQPSKNHIHILLSFFGHKSFRPMQWKIISSILNDERDICAIMATGYGKSLCYQYPAIYSGGITIVISPLISLMEDQVLSLKLANISACLLGSANTKQSETTAEIFESKHSLVYITPEFACGDSGSCLLRDMNAKLKISLVAIDEAHCVSSWGHDFRFQYRQLGTLKKIFPKVPFLAVTATATPRVRNDIVTSLKLRATLFYGDEKHNLLSTPDIYVYLETIKQHIKNRSVN